MPDTGIPCVSPRWDVVYEAKPVAGFFFNSYIILRIAKGAYTLVLFHVKLVSGTSNHVLLLGNFPWCASGRAGNLVDNPWGLGEARLSDGQYEASGHCCGWCWTQGTHDRGQSALSLCFQHCHPNRASKLHSNPMTIIPTLQLRGYSRCWVLLKAIQEGGRGRTFWFQMFVLKAFKEKS